MKKTGFEILIRKRLDLGIWSRECCGLLPGTARDVRDGDVLVVLGNGITRDFALWALDVLTFIHVDGTG